MSTYFVSGHLDVTGEEFLEHYVPRMQAAMAEGSAFVVDDARGCDLLAQEYLLAAGYTGVTVYHMLEAPRNNAGFPSVGGFANDAQRDAAMTAVSTDDLAWVRPGRENSGTSKNLKRRL
jgi:hypothetical protein